MLYEQRSQVHLQDRNTWSPQRAYWFSVMKNQLTNTNKPFDLVLTEILWDYSFLSLTDGHFFPVISERGGCEIWLSALIRNYLSQSVMRGGIYGGVTGLMLAAINWTDRPGRSVVFVSGCSEVEYVGPQRCLLPNPALLFSQGLRGSCESGELSVVHCLLCRYSQARRIHIFSFISISFLFFLFFNGGWQHLFSAFLSAFPFFLFALLSFFLCSKLWGDEEGKREDQREPTHSALQYH